LPVVQLEQLFVAVLFVPAVVGAGHCGEAKGYFRTMLLVEATPVAGAVAFFAFLESGTLSMAGVAPTRLAIMAMVSGCGGGNAFLVSGAGRVSASLAAGTRTSSMMAAIAKSSAILLIATPPRVLRVSDATCGS
jgi:hypothetical protein